jgi:hypothetical protein
MSESNGNPRPWRDTATLLLAVVLAVAAVSVVFDGGRSAFAADDCQYGPYGSYGQQCAKARPSLRVSAPSTAGIGTSVVPVAILENGDNPTGTLIVRLHRPGQQCASPSQPPFWLAQVEVHGNGSYLAGLPPPFDQLGAWRWSATYVGDARNELTHTVCGAFDTEVVKRTPFLFLTLPSSLTVGGFATVFGSTSLYQPNAPLTLRVYPPHDPGCTGTPAFSRQVAVPFFTETLGPLGLEGTWRFVLSYPGDANNHPAATACDTYRLSVTRQMVSLGLAVSPQSATIGQTVSATTSVLGFEPTGSLTVRLFGPTDTTCSSPVETKTFAVQGSGPYTLEFTANRVGSWLVSRSYSGDAANMALIEACGLHGIQVQKAVPRLELVADPTSATRNDRLSARVQLRDGYQPTGRVTFRLYYPTDPACAGSPAYVEEATIVSGVASTVTGFQVPKEAPGTWNWKATYGGDDNNASVGSQCGEARVNVSEPGADPQHTVVRFASNTSTQAYSGYPSSVDGGPPPTLLGAAQLVCLSAAGCPPGATDYGSPFGGAWTSDLSSIPGAAWIWRPGVTGETSGADHDQVVFAWTIVLAGRPGEAWIAIAADDYAEIRVNGELVGSIGGSAPAYGSLTRFDLGSFVRAGSNAIAILARNGPWCGSCPFSQNPAGVVFGGEITVQ